MITVRILQEKLYRFKTQKDFEEWFPDGRTTTDNLDQLIQLEEPDEWTIVDAGVVKS